MGMFVEGEHQKPSSGRKGDHEVVEGAHATLDWHLLYCNALSLSRLRRQLPPGGSLLITVAHHPHYGISRITNLRDHLVCPPFPLVDPDATHRPAGSTASARIWAKPKCVILNEAKPRSGCEVELRSSTEQSEVGSRADSAQDDTMGASRRFEYRPQTVKLVSENPDGDVRRKKGETPLVVSPLSPYGEIHPFGRFRTIKEFRRLRAATKAPPLETASFWKSSTKTFR